MYKFPNDFDGREFVSRALEMICLNANQVYLHFGNRISICTETPFLYNKHSPHGDSIPVSIPPTNVDLIELLEHRVTDVALSEGKNLTLLFDSGQSLSFVEEQEPYESYKLVFGDKVIII